MESKFMLSAMKSTQSKNLSWLVKSGILFFFVVAYSFLHPIDKKFERINFNNSSYQYIDIQQVKDFLSDYV